MNMNTTTTAMPADARHDLASLGLTVRFLPFPEHDRLVLPNGDSWSIPFGLARALRDLGLPAVRFDRDGRDPGNHADVPTPPLVAGGV